MSTRPLVHALVASVIALWSFAEPICAQVSLLKADNVFALDSALSWNPASLPTPADTITWNGSYSNTSSSVGSGLSVRQITIQPTVQPISIVAGNGTLTIGSGGLDFTAASQNLTISAPLTLGAAQSWSGANGRSVLLTGNLTAVASPLTVTSGAVILSPGAGQAVSLSGNASALLLQVRPGGMLVLGGDGQTSPLTAATNTILSTGSYGALSITGNGTAQVNSGTWNCGDLGRNSSADYFSGALEVRGGVLSVNGARFLAGGNIVVSGGIFRVTNFGSIYSNGGKFALGSVGPSTSAASLSITGGTVDLAQANSAVNGGNSLGVGISAKVLQTGGTLQNGITAAGGTNGGNSTTFTIGHTGLTSTGSGASITYSPVSNVLASYTLSGGTLLSAGAIQGATPAAAATNGSSGSPPNGVVNPGTGNLRNFNFLGGTLSVGAFNATFLGYSSSTGTAGAAPSSDPSANSVGIGTLYNHGGTLAPGGPGIAGRTSITGNYVVVSGSLDVDLGGLTQATGFQSGQYDFLSVNGTTTLGGALNVRLLPGFTPAANSTFTILSSSGNLTGGFANALFDSRIVSVDGLSTFVLSKVGNTLTLGQFLPVTQPAITSSTSPTLVVEGSPITLSVSVSSLAPVSYQWRKNGVAIAGATSASLVLPSPTSSDSGSYDVVVSNAAGSSTSTAIPVTVTLPRTTRTLTVDAGASRQFDATPGCQSYQWRLNGAAVGSNSANFTLSPDVNLVGTHWLQVKETYSDNSTYTRQWAVRVRIPQPQASVTYYVSPSGSDSGNGSIASPFLTLEKARDTIRTLPRPLPAGGVTVYLRGGTHTRNSTFTLGASDSGSTGSPIVYANYPGETAVLSAGKAVLSSQFAPLAASEASRVAPGTDPTRIWEADLPTLGISRRGPFPNVFGEWQIFNALAGSNGGLCELFYNGKRMVLSQYPNRNLSDDSLTTFMKMNGVATGADAAGTGYLNSAGNYTTSNGTVVPVSAAFHYNPADAARVARWQTAMSKGGVWLMGYWRVPWQVNGVRVSVLDTGTKGVIGFASGANISNGIGNKYVRPTGSKTEPFWAINLLEEMDQPGEWCIDFSRNKLYFLMDSAGAPPDRSVVISDLSSAMVQISGTNLCLQGLTFEYGLAQGVQILGGSRNLITGCTFRNMGGYPVDMNNLSGGSFNGVVSCDMKDLASGGVIVRGGNSTASPRIPTNNYVVNNKITDYARVVRVYAAAVDVGYMSGRPTVGVRVAHNATSGSPHVGMLWRDFDHSIEFNDISDYCYFSNDMGGIYTYAANYISNTVIRYNLLRDSDQGEGIYFDSDHINATVYGNVANLKTLPSASRGNGFYDQTPSATTTAGLPLTDTYYNNFAVNCRFGFTIYSATGGTIENNFAFNNLTSPFRWNRVTANGTAVSWSSASASVLGSGPNISYSSNPGFLDFAGDDLRLRPDSTVYRDMPGFQTIPLEMTGLYNDESRSDAKVFSPFITTGRASNLGSNVASLNGVLAYPQFEANANVLLYWGTTDGGSDPSAWQQVEDLGTPQPGDISRTLTALSPGTQYFFRFFASNSAGSMWAEQSNSFTTFPASNASTGGTASANSGSAAAAFDNSPSSVWQTNASATGWIQYEFANNSPRIVTQYQVTSAPDSPSRDPRNWEFLGSNDGQNWTVLDVETNQTFSSRGQTRSYGFVNVQPFLFYRLNVTANNGDASVLQLAELRLLSPNAVPDTTGPVITTPGNLFVTAGSSNGEVVDFSVSAIDAVSGAVTPIITPPSGSLFPVGSSLVTVSATDAAGNTSNASFTVTVTAPSLPSPWTVRNVGSYTSLGSATHSNGTFTINATGGTTGITGDIWTGTTDNFTYISQPWSGDGIFTARLVSFSATDASAKAGIMFRETTNVGSKYSFSYLLKKGDAWSQHKTTPSGSSGAAFVTTSSAGRGVPEWVRLVRKGNTFSSFISENGTTWTPLGNSTANTLAGTSLSVGFAVGPRTANGTAAAVFDNVSFQSVPAAPTGLAAMPGVGQVSLTWNAVPGATSYSVRRADSPGGGAVLIASGLTSPAYSDQEVVPDTIAYYSVFATNAVGNGAPSAEAGAAPLTAIQAWRMAFFATPENSGSAADSADPDRDGVTNLMEYALGRNPLVAGSSAPLSQSFSNDRLQISFSRIADPGITYRVEASPNLADGTWVEIWQSTGDANTVGPVNVADTVDLSTAQPPSRFLRLRVTSP